MNGNITGVLREALEDGKKRLMLGKIRFMDRIRPLWINSTTGNLSIAKLYSLIITPEFLEDSEISRMEIYGLQSINIVGNNERFMLKLARQGDLLEMTKVGKRLFPEVVPILYAKELKKHSQSLTGCPS